MRGDRRPDTYAAITRSVQDESTIPAGGKQDHKQLEQR
jgi:hypothetical protein